MSTELTKLTVNLTPRSVEALNKAYALQDDAEITRTDIVNRAIQLYAYLVEVPRDHRILIEDQMGDLHVMSWR